MGRLYNDAWADNWGFVPITEPDVAAMVKDYRGDPAAAQAEAFDATPANIDARTQRFDLQSGMQAALPSVDHFVSGHSLAAFEQLAGVIEGA